MKRIWSPAMLLFLVLALALGFRLWGVSFGLPSLFDPDEPLFVVNGVKLLKEQTLNPGWFGHPATTTFYALALIDIGVYAWGALAGLWASPEEFTRFLYTDPTLLFLPGRLFIVACGLGCIATTFVLARRLFGLSVAAAAALFLALSPLHIEYSQIIRSDMTASLFMLLSLLSATGMTNGSRKHAILAGVMAGLACASKWPAALIIVVPICLSLTGMSQPGSSFRARVTEAAIVGFSSLAALFIVSPYLLLDWQTVVANLGSEGRTQHAGATGGTVIENFLWYIKGPLVDAFGLPLLLLSVVGIGAASRDRRHVIFLLIPTFLFMALISSRALIWARWVVPILPLLAILSAIAFFALLNQITPTRIRFMSGVVAMVLLAGNLAFSARLRAIERTHDTRDLAADWVIRNVPRGNSILIEHIAYRLYSGGWSFRYPMGSAGCVDGVAVLKGRVKLKDVEKTQGGRPAINIGSIAPEKIDSCYADFAVFTKYDQYLQEEERWAPELKIYSTLMKRAQPCVTFRPVPGRIGGPIVRIFGSSGAVCKG